MGKIRVLLVDDSLVMRRLLHEALSEDPNIEIVGYAADGAKALDQVRQLNPDIVTMDVEMPGLNGLDTLSRIRESHPRLPVIMFSRLTEKGARTTLEALCRGATDYVTKPTETLNINDARAHVARELTPKIRDLFMDRRVKTMLDGLVRRKPSAAWTGATVPIEILAMGVSTGGPSALESLFKGLPPSLPVPVVLVQHMPPLFTRLLAERLTEETGFPASEAKDGESLSPGRALIAPGDFHMVVALEQGRPVVRIQQDPPVNSSRPSVDVLFRSVAKVFGPRSMAVILTGMGQDGLRGAEALWEAGASIVAQDEATSVVWGMPGAVARAGLAGKVLPLEKIPEAIMERVSLRKPSDPPAKNF